MPDGHAAPNVNPADLPQDRLRALSKALRQIARDAAVIVEKFKAEGFEPETKEDGSVVTPADRASEALIRAKIEDLRKDFADILPANTAFVGEEGMAAGDKPDTRAGNFFVVDPIDGTSNYVYGERGKNLYTINIALVLDNKPVLGVVHEPVSGDQIATLDATASVISVGGGPDIPLVPGAEKDHKGRPLPRYKKGAMSYADIVRGHKGDYRHKESYEWDTAAQHAILNTVGGGFYVEATKEPLAYNKADVKFFNPAVIGTMQMPGTTPDAAPAASPAPKK
jgi:3'-phosphoadenosine 5'-phosphosulfate (PAPS) 3'-phosphatase